MRLGKDGESMGDAKLKQVFDAFPEDVIEVIDECADDELCPFCGKRVYTTPVWSLDRDVTDESNDLWRADCECGFTGPDCDTEEEAMDEVRQMWRRMRANEGQTGEAMSMNDYQRLAQRTANETEQEKKLDNGILGLCGEVGEIADQIKKYRHQGHDLDRGHMIEELGDVLWYCAELAAGMGTTLDQVAEANVEKLRARYPDGFDAERSRNRE